jgi:hypothetical protein
MLRTHAPRRLIVYLLILIALMLFPGQGQAGSPQQAGEERIESDSPLVVKSGRWNFQARPAASAGGYLYSSGPDDALALTFSGTAVEVVYVAGPSFGPLAIEVDGEVLRTVSTRSATPRYQRSATVAYLSPGPHQLRVYAAEGMIGVDAFVFDPPAEVLAPAATGSVSGTVRSGGDGLEGIPVRAVYADLSWAGATCSGADGTYTLSGLAYDRDVYVVAGGESSCAGAPLQAYARQYYPSAFDLPNADPLLLLASMPDVSGIDFSLAAGARLSGQTRNGTGTAALPGMALALYHNDWAYSPYLSTCSDPADGSFALVVPYDQDFILRAGGDGTCAAGTTHYAVEFYQPDMADVRLPGNGAVIQIANGEPDLVVGPLNLDETATASGTVTAQDSGQPLGDIAVAWVVGEYPNWQTGATCTNSVNGTYTLDNIPPGARVRFQAPYRWHHCGVSNDLGIEYWDNKGDFDAAGSLTLSPGQTVSTPIDFTLGEDGVVSGYVFDSDATTPLQGVLVEVAGVHPAVSTCTDADGFYRLDRLPLNQPLKIKAGDPNRCTTYPGEEWLDNKPSEAAADTITLTDAHSHRMGVNFIFSHTLALQAPVGDVSSRTPVFTWIEGPAAEAYHLRVRLLDGTVVFQEWYTVGETVACPNGMCSLKMTTPLGNAIDDTRLRWDVQPYRADTGTGAWTDSEIFRIKAPQPLSPDNGRYLYHQTGQVTLQWLTVQGMDWYEIYLSGPDYLYNEWHPSDALNCTSVCTLITEPLPQNGSYRWYIRASGLPGDSPWSEGRYFMLHVISQPGVVTGRQPFDASVLSDAAVTFSWDNGMDAGYYLLYLAGPAGTSLNGYHTVSVADACDESGGSGCSETIELDANGTWTWYIAGYNPAGNGPWSQLGAGDNWGAQSFTLNTPVPGQVLKTAPLQGANLSSGLVSFAWQPDPDARAYETYVDGPGSYVDYQSWPAAEVCSGGTCSVDLLLPANGQYTWYLRGMGQAGAGPWGPNDAGGNVGAVTFSVNAGQPGQVLKTAPLGGTVSGLPISFRWQAEANASSYRLYVSGPNFIHDRTYPEHEICAAGTCEALVMPDFNGDYTWYLQGISAAGGGPWGPDDPHGTWGAAYFTLAAPAPVDYAARLTPEDNSIWVDNPVSFGWDAAENAAWYNFILADCTSGEIVSQSWHTAESLGCLAGEGETCSLEQTIGAGVHRWLVRNWGAGSSGVPDYLPLETPTCRIIKLGS